jgi:hypothetical protein
MEYPPEVLTISKRGRREVRHLLDRGRFVRYDYLDPSTGERTENKVKLVLVGEGGVEEYFIVPTKERRRSLLLAAEEKGERKLWDGRAVVDL